MSANTPLLRDSFNDWRGRLPKEFDGLPFLYIGPVSDSPGHFEIGFWDEGNVVPYVACEEEVFVTASGEM